MDLKSIGIRAFSLDNYNNNYVLLIISNDKTFIKSYVELFGIEPYPHQESQSGIYPTGKPMSYKLPKSKLNKMIVNTRKTKLESLK
jgi:hypothetical protein